MKYYYTDANKFNDNLIELFDDKLDIYRQSENIDKFKHWVCEKGEIQSSFKSIVQTLIKLGSTNHFNNLDFKGEFGERVKKARDQYLAIVWTSVDELIVHLMANGRPSPENARTNHQLIADTVKKLWKTLITAEYSKYIIPDEDRHFISRAYQVQYNNERRGRGGKLNPIEDFIKDAGMEKYFYGHRGAEGEELPLQFNAWSNKKEAVGGKFDWQELDAYENFYKEIWTRLEKANLVLNCENSEELQFMRDELHNYPKILPVKAKLLIESGIKQISNEHAFDEMDLIMLLKHQHKALEIPAGGPERSPKRILINNESFMKVVDDREAAADLGR